VLEGGRPGERVERCGARVKLGTTFAPKILIRILFSSPKNVREEKNQEGLRRALRRGEPMATEAVEASKAGQAARLPEVLEALRAFEDSAKRAGPVLALWRGSTEPLPDLVGILFAVRTSGRSLPSLAESVDFRLLALEAEARKAEALAVKAAEQDLAEFSAVVAELAVGLLVGFRAVVHPIPIAFDGFRVATAQLDTSLEWFDKAARAWSPIDRVIDAGDRRRGAFLLDGGLTAARARLATRCNDAL